MSREKFGLALKGHDWYYAYSDDSRVWRNGQSQSDMLNKRHKELDCPYNMTTLRKWSHNLIVEQFVEEIPGEWYRHPRKYKSIAPCKREDLITQELHDQVTQWMIELGGSTHGLSSFA